MAQYLLSFGLQLFADGGGGAAGGAAAGGAPGVSAADAGQTGAQTAPAQGTDGADAEIDADAAFEELIKGQYKAQYDKRVQDTVQRRLKSTKAEAESYRQSAEKTQPLLATLAMKYKLDADDVDGIIKAVDEDDSYWEEAAFEKGVPVEVLKETMKLKRENEALRKQDEARAQQEQIDRDLARWAQEAQAVKAAYPNFDFQKELNDPTSGPQFLMLLKSGVSMDAAFYAVHSRELNAANMQFAAAQAQKQTLDTIMARGARPTENGNRGTSAATYSQDVSKMTKAQREELIQRARRGERITFS